MEITKEKYTISTDNSKLDIDFIHNYLSGYSYWAEEIPVAIVVKAIEGSLCFGLYEGDKQIGFARMVTDKATFAYMADVFVDEHYRGRGLSKWLVATMLAHPDMQGLRRLMLATRDAHGLYAQFGFTPLNHPERLMQMVFPDIYKKKP
jgi:N-acetylglutamate synthase-like GNAT family acetyltransferase